MAMSEESKMENKKPFVLGMDRLDDMVPTFFLGLGGTGGKVLDVLSSRLRAEPNWHRYRELLQFISIDTDAGDLDILRKRGHQVSNISVSDKKALIKAARGETQGIPADERITSWVHDWYGFRDASAKGAGQIRLESRFSLYQQLRSQAIGNVRSLLKERLDVAIRARNPNSGAQAAVRFFLYGSLAGGTGSGANIAIAYLCWRLAYEAGIPDAGVEVYGTFFLPSLFRAVNRGPLVHSINANGYAALKEIEHLMELHYDRTGSAKEQHSTDREVEYIHDPSASPGRQIVPEDRVGRAPFKWVYIVDQPEGRTIDPRQIYRTVGELALLQLFSPILRQQDSDNDNFQKMQRELRNGYFAVQYGSVGAAVLEFPRRALVNYCARRVTIEQLERLVVGRGTDNVGKVGQARSSAEDFRDLSEHEQNRILDAEFGEFIQDSVKREQESKKPGMFSDIVTDGTRMESEFGQQLLNWYDETFNSIDINGVDGPSLSEENPSIDGFYRNLCRDFRAASDLVSARLAAIGRELAEGRVFGKLFESASPLTQRYVLTVLNQRGLDAAQRVASELEDDKAKAKALRWCLMPGQESDWDAYAILGQGPMDRAEFDPEKEEIRKRVQEANRRLQEARDKWGFASAKERAFADARQSVMSQFNGDVINNVKDGLMRMFWSALASLVERAIADQLDIFRGTAKAALGSVSRLRAQAESSRATGIALASIAASFTAGEEDAASELDGNFHLGTEVFCDHRTGQRMWDEIYRLRVAGKFSVEPKDLVNRINSAMAKRKAEHQKLSEIRGSDVLVDILVAMEEELRQRMDGFMAAEATGFDLLGGLELEARIVTAARAGQVTADKVDAVGDEAIMLYVNDKVTYVRNMSLPLGRIDRGLVAGADLGPYEPRFVGRQAMKGMGGAIQQASKPGVVEAAMSRATEGFNALRGWNTPDVVTLFQGVLGLPLYAWMDVNADLKRSYQYEVNNNAPNPLHTDKRYEPRGFNGQTGLGLPDLDIGARQAWEAARQQEEERKAREAMLPAVVRLMAAQVVRLEGGQYVMALDELLPIGATLIDAVGSLSQQMLKPAVKRAYLAAAGTPTQANWDALDAKFNQMLARAAVVNRESEMALLESLLASFVQAKQL